FREFPGPYGGPALFKSCAPRKKVERQTALWFSEPRTPQTSDISEPASLVLLREWMAHQIMSSKLVRACVLMVLIIGVPLVLFPRPMRMRSGNENSYARSSVLVSW